MSDVYPRRNLGAAEHWGRTVEGRQDGVKAIFENQGQRVQGQDRYIASSEAEFSKMVEQTQDLAEDIEVALLAFPRYFTEAVERTGFGIGSGWTTLATANFQVPEGYDAAEISATGIVISEQSAGTVTHFSWPFNPAPLGTGAGTVTSEFGPRPPLPYHNGIDFGGPTATTGVNIPCAANGPVILKGYYEDWGNYMRVSHTAITGAPNTWTGYAHMQSPSPHSVGDTVTRGQTLGQIGSTGYVTGPHLHWETAVENVRINPRDFMDVFGGTTASYAPVRARIVVAGSASPSFYPFTDVGLGPEQTNFAVWGSSPTGLEPGEIVTVALQAYASSKVIGADVDNQAILTVTGGFQ